MKMRTITKPKKILLLDFDGVLHEYSSGWKGARNIPDPPVSGALEFLVEAIKYFDVCIYSARSRQFGGKRAMRKWLKKHYYELGMSLSGANDETFGNPFWKFISETAFADPWEYEVEWAISRLLKKIRFPTKKPAAFLTIDDRCFRFDGVFPDVAELLDFKPWWNK